MVEGKDIEESVKGLRGTSISQIEPNRDKKKAKFNTLTGISSWFEFQFPTDGEYSGYIQARALPHIGVWKRFAPAQIKKLSKTEINIPTPIISIPSIPQTSWTTPMPHVTGHFFIINDGFQN